MENSHHHNTSSVPWQSPASGLRKNNRRRLRTPLKQSSQQQQQEAQQEGNQHYTRTASSPTPGTPNNNNSERFIWRTRSLDDDGSGLKNSALDSSGVGLVGLGTNNSKQLEPHDEYEYDTSHDEHQQPQSLHSSFDASLLAAENDFHSVFRVNQRRASTTGTAAAAAMGTAATATSTSTTRTRSASTSDGGACNNWNNNSNSSHHRRNNSNGNSDYLVSTPHSSGRKHLRRPPCDAAHDRNNDLTNNRDRDDTNNDDFICPGTVRKLARHNSSESAHSRGGTTPVRRWNSSAAKSSSIIQKQPSTASFAMSSSSYPSSVAPPPPPSMWKAPSKLCFPLTPTAPNSTATTQPPTTQQQQQHPHSNSHPAPPQLHPPQPYVVDRSDGPNSTTPFRFTSFPASLPRVHPPMLRGGGATGGGGGGGCSSEQPDSVRKRMFGVPPSHLGTVSSSSNNNNPTPLHHNYYNNHQNNTSQNQNNTSQSHSYRAEEEGTQNTSISSLSTHGEEDPRMPPVHARLFQDAAEYAYSSDDDDIFDNANNHQKVNRENGFAAADDDDDNAAVGRTRLNFNTMMSPPHKKTSSDPSELSSIGNTANDESPFKDLGEAAEKDLLRMTDDNEDAFDLSRPYEQRHVHSFPSTMSSHSPLRNLSGCDDKDMPTASTAGMTGHGGLMEGEPSHASSLTSHQQHRHHASQTHHQPHPSRQNSSSHPHYLPATPEEVQLLFQFDETQCSPIPGIPDEEDFRRRPPLSLRSGKQGASRLPPKPCPPPESSDPAVATSSNNPTSNKSITPPRSRDSATPQEDVRASSFSHESVASSTASARLRRRPMPDMSAFEMDSGSRITAGHDRSTDDMSGTIMSAPSPKLHCPPTPVRTPAWAHENEISSKAEVGGPLVFHRSNSLTMTRVLATCTDTTFPSMEGAAASDPNSSGSNNTEASMDQEMDMGPPSSDAPSKEPEHPEAPPRIRRAQSVGEMGSISSFATDFETLGMLGKGAFADVYKVRSKLDNNLYAVKRNRRHFRGKRDRDIALTEVRSMQRLQQQSIQHQEEQQQETNQSLPYLLFFYRAWQEDGHFFCQTELCCRDTCTEMMDSLSIEWNLARNRYPSLLRNLPAPEGIVAGSPFDVSGRLVPDMTVWKICHDICAGLSHIHARGLVHNDIKPSNIFFVGHSQLGSLCKIGDFGMAAEIGTSEDGQEGDQKFMAPELLDTEVKLASADVFSLGLTLYEIAAGFGFDLPKQGPRWHELRSGNHTPDLPSVRDTAIGKLIQQMITPSQDRRPVAEDIWKHEKVRFAGSTCDEFLRDYIKDIDEFDRQEDERRAAVDNISDDQTPRNGSNAAGASCRVRVCSPTLGSFSTTSHNPFSPEAQST